MARQRGEFRVGGKIQSVVIHELLCRSDAESGEEIGIEIFEKGLGIFRAGEFVTTRQDIERTREMRAASDGPSEFHVRKIANLEANVFSSEQAWTGVVELSAK